jgi:hypothetical protein
MDKYHFNIRLSNVRYNHAGSKAVEDCKATLLNTGFKDIEISFVKKLYMMPVNIIKLMCLLALYRFKVKPHSLILIQYPLLGINKYFKHFAKMLKSKHCKLVCIIHDLDSIRSDNQQREVNNEIDALNAYDAVIAHNPAMSQWLLAEGYKGHITTIQLFDYLLTTAPSAKSVVESTNSVAFAGNLGRCNFLPLLNELNGVRFNLYGPGLEPNVAGSGQNISWKGSFSPEQIVDELQGAFGLIWDGTSIETYAGVMGNYLKYNTPHKASLYLVSGLPVIVHHSAAIADYIQSNTLGIVVGSLKELDSKLVELSTEQYENMKANALNVSKQLQDGYFLKRAVASVISQLTD